MNRLKRMTHWFATPAYDREIAAFCHQFGFSRGHSTLAAFEGLFMASMCSILFWSGLMYVLFLLG